MLITLAFLLYMVKFQHKSLIIEDEKQRENIKFPKNSFVLFKNTKCINASINELTNIFSDDENKKHTETIIFRKEGNLQNVSLLQTQECLSSFFQDNQVNKQKTEELTKKDIKLDHKQYNLEYDYYQLFDFTCDTIDFIKSKQFYYKFENSKELQKHRKFIDKELKENHGFRQCLFLDFDEEQVNISLNVSKYHSLYKDDFYFGKKNTTQVKHALFHMIISDIESDDGDEIYSIKKLDNNSRTTNYLKRFANSLDKNTIDKDHQIILMDRNDDDHEDEGLLLGLFHSLWELVGAIIGALAGVIGLLILMYCIMTGLICQIVAYCFTCCCLDTTDD